MEYQNCLICHSNSATKRNSHLVPSFIIAKICSYDGSGKRDKEVLFSFDYNSVNLYLGQLPDTKIEELINNNELTEERINQLKENPVSLDYIFCPKCEFHLSKYLESPYSHYLNQQGELEPHIAYFFWLSIVWRMSISNLFGFKLPIELENKIGESLHNYLKARDNKEEVEQIVKDCGLTYRLLTSPGFLPENSSSIFAKFDETFNVLTILLGDTILCIPFENEISKKFKYFGISNSIRRAPSNNGLEPEQSKYISIKGLNSINQQLTKIGSKLKINFYWELVNKFWQQIGLKGSMPSYIFQDFMHNLCSEEVKLGERHTNEHIYETLMEVLYKYGIIDKGPY